MNEQSDELADFQGQLQKTHGGLPDNVAAHKQVTDAIEKLNHSTKLIPTYEEYIHDLEMPPPSPDFELTTSTVDLTFPSNGEFALENVQPIGKREVVINDEEPIEADILGVVTFESTNEQYQVLKLPNGTVLLGQLMPDGTFELPNVEKDVRKHASQHVSKGDLLVAANEKNGVERTTIRFSEGLSNARRANPHLLLAEETKRIDIVKEQSEEIRRKKVRRTRRLAQVGLAAFTLWLGVTPGGLTDVVMDPLVHANSVVAQAELIGGNAGENHKAGEAVSRLLNDLDNNNYEAVKKAADTYREQHPDAFINKETLAQINQSIARATSSREIEVALRPAKEYYGYAFMVSNDIPLSAAKYTAEQIVAELSSIPKDLLNDARVQLIGIDSEVETELETQSTPKDGVEGYYDYDEEGIHIKVNTRLNEDISRLRTPVGVDNGSGVQDTFAHEFGHALIADLPGIFPVDGSQITGDTEDDATHDFLVGGILDTPTVMGSYARTDSDENIAENISGILSQRRDGLAWPDDSRAFASESNRSLVATLIVIEKRHPGITAPLLEHRFTAQLG